MSAKFYEVGGTIRDKLLGLTSNDTDFAVECESFDAMRQAIIAREGKIFLETPEYFTIRAKIPILGAADFVLCRKDGEYNNGRHPDSVTVGNLVDDLARRDFTINAIARDVDTDEYIDPHNGQDDIKKLLVRCVGDPIKRFTEDKLRVFRAVRFAITKGMAIEGRTGKAIEAMEKEDFDNISTERIRAELMKMLQHDTRQTCTWIFKGFPYLGTLAMKRGIWFKPTTEKV